MRRRTSLLLLTTLILSACGDDGAGPQPTGLPTALQIDVPGSVTEGLPFELELRALGSDQQPLAGFSGVVTLQVSDGDISPGSVSLADGEATVDAGITDALGQVTVRASIAELEAVRTVEVAPGGDLLEGAPDDPAAAAIPDLPFTPRTEDYSDTHPELGGLFISFNTLVLVFEPGTVVGEANAVLATLGADIVGGIPGTPEAASGILFLRLATTDHVEMESTLEVLREEPHVRVAVQDALLEEAIVSRRSGGTPAEWSWDRTPAGGNWGMELLRAPLLWNFNPAVEKSGDMNVGIGILDIGFADTHEDLAYAANLTPGDEGDHGTHVAGITGATFDNGVGVDGINPFARSQLVVSGGTGSVPFADVFARRRSMGGAMISDLRTLVQSRPAMRVVNISLGYNWAKINIDANNNPRAQRLADDQGRIFRTMLETLSADGAMLPVIVVSAGNDSGTSANGTNMGLQDTRYSSPMTNAAVAQNAAPIIVVEALTLVAGEATRWSESNVGGHVSAPGADVLSTVGSGYTTNSGTSMAAPHVAGLVGYLYALDPVLPSPTLDDNFMLDVLQGSAAPAAGAASARVDAMAAAFQIDELIGDHTILRRLVDIDDGTPDGNLRVDPEAGDGSDYTETDADLDGGVGDGNVDMSDFRRWRDGVLYLVDPPELDLDGSQTHPKKDLNANGTVDYADEFLYPFMDLNGDTLFDNSKASVPSLGQVSDLEVLQEAFDDPHYRKEHLDALLFSADIAVRPAELLEEEDVAAIHSSVRPAGEEEAEEDPRFRRVHTGDEEDGEGLWQVYTVPISEDGYTARIVALDAAGDTIHEIETDFAAAPGQDSSWNPSALTCPAGEPETTLIETVGTWVPEGGTYETKIDDATWGRVTGRVRTESEEGELGPGITMELGWIDHVALVPVDSSDMERAVLIRMEASGIIAISGSDPENSSVHTHFSIGDSCPGCPLPYDEFEDSRRFSQDGPGTFETEGVAYLSGRIGDWIDFVGYLAINVGSDFDGSSSASEASLEIGRLIDVVDSATGDPVAIKEICTASGHTYPE